QRSQFAVVTVARSMCQVCRFAGCKIRNLAILQTWHPDTLQVSDPAGRTKRIMRMITPAFPDTYRTIRESGATYLARLPDSSAHAPRPSSERPGLPCSRVTPLLWHI